MDAPQGTTGVICVPPRHMKSYLVNVFFPAFLWLRNPGAQFLSITNSDTLGGRDSLRMRQVIQSEPYKELVERAHMAFQIPTFGLSKEMASRENFQNTQHGSRQCLSVGARITGQGCDYMLIDDPYDAKEAVQGSVDSIAERMRDVVSIHDIAWSSRFNAGGPKKKLVIMQRLHDLDIAAELIKRGANSLVLPMHFDPRRADPLDWRIEQGELLSTPDWHPIPVEHWVNALGDQAGAQLEQAPVPASGGIFNAVYWTWQDRTAFPASYDREGAGWDLAFGKNENGAFHAGVFGGLHKGILYLQGVVRGRMDTPELMAQMTAARSRWPRAYGWWMENRASAKAVYELLRSKIPGIVLVEPKGDKETRARAWQPYVRSSNIVLPCRCGNSEFHHHADLHSLPGEDWACELVREHASFPKGAIKDQVDAMGYLAIEMLGRKPPSATTA
jgi:phage terminase large subunit-like protein